MDRHYIGPEEAPTTEGMRTLMIRPPVFHLVVVDEWEARSEKSLWFKADGKNHAH